MRTNTIYPDSYDKKRVSEQNTEDLGMLYLPTLGIFTKVFKDKKGMYVKLPNSKKKFYLGEEEKGD